MRVAALYDIHGNLPALEATLDEAEAEAEAEGVDLLLFGGDVAAGPMPMATIDRLAALAGRARFVRGNADRSMVEVFDGTRQPSPFDGWAAAQISRWQRDFLATFEVLLGVATVVFAVGLTLSLQQVASGLSRERQVQVNVFQAPDQPAGDVRALLRSAPHTARFVAEGRGQATVPGIATPVPFYGYDGDSSWTGYPMISGRWFRGPGEVVAPSHLMDVTGLHVGQGFTVTMGGRAVPVTLVGEVFDQTDDDLLLRGAWADVTHLDPPAAIDQYEVQLTPGADARQYAS